MALEDFFEGAVILDKTTVSDGLGGVITQWREGAEIRAGFSTKNSTEAQIAYKSGTKTIYTIVFSDLLELAQNDRVRRHRDGKVFRVTSDSEDMRTPAPSEMKFKQVSAEVISV